MENEDEVESLSVSDSSDSSEEYTADLEEEEEEELDLDANNEEEDEPCVSRSVPNDQDRKSKNVDALLRSVQSDFVNQKHFSSKIQLIRL